MAILNNGLEFKEEEIKVYLIIKFNNCLTKIFKAFKMVVVFTISNKTPICKFSKNNSYQNFKVITKIAN